jgi:hypothetical protein
MKMGQIEPLSQFAPAVEAQNSAAAAVKTGHEAQEGHLADGSEAGDVHICAHICANGFISVWRCDCRKQ